MLRTIREPGPNGPALFPHDERARRDDRRGPRPWDDETNVDECARYDEALTADVDLGAIELAVATPMLMTAPMSDGMLTASLLSKLRTPAGVRPTRYSRVLISSALR